MPPKLRVPNKPKRDVKRRVELQIRETDYVAMVRAAEAADLPLATWLRLVALEAAKAA